MAQPSCFPAGFAVPGSALAPGSPDCAARPASVPVPVVPDEPERRRPPPLGRSRSPPRRGGGGGGAGGALGALVRTGTRPLLCHPITSYHGWRCVDAE